MKYKAGDTVRILLKNQNEYKIHICAVIDEEYIAFKFYGKHKQWWHYDILHTTDIDFKAAMLKRRIKEG